MRSIASAVLLWHMLGAVSTFLLQAAVISLSGVMAPGPVTAATLAAGARNRHAGAWVAVGHGIVEFPLMLVIMAGAGAALAARGFRVGVGLAGGAALLLMAGVMLAGLRRPADDAAPQKAAGPVWTGVLLTGGNPLFLLWWATVGLALTARAVELGALAFGLFALVHWLCDLVWLEALSLASNRGLRLLGPRSRRAVVAICCLAMGAFGVRFIIDALRSA